MTPQPPRWRWSRPSPTASSTEGSAGVSGAATTSAVGSAGSAARGLATRGLEVSRSTATPATGDGVSVEAATIAGAVIAKARTTVKANSRRSTAVQKCARCFPRRIAATKPSLCVPCNCRDTKCLPQQSHSGIPRPDGRSVDHSTTTKGPALISASRRPVPPCAQGANACRHRRGVSGLPQPGLRFTNPNAPDPDCPEAIPRCCGRLGRWLSIGWW